MLHVWFLINQMSRADLKISSQNKMSANNETEITAKIKKKKLLE